MRVESTGATPPPAAAKHNAISVISVAHQERDHAAGRDVGDRRRHQEDDEAMVTLMMLSVS
jgi:hypothetical protein